MRNTLKIGDVFSLPYVVPVEKTIVHLYPEFGQHQHMLGLETPQVFATGFMVGLIELCCCNALFPHLEGGEGSLGTFISTTHSAPTPPGMEVVVTVTCDEIRAGNNIFWTVLVRDEIDTIAQGRHGRHVINFARFEKRVQRKAFRVTQTLQEALLAP